MIIKALKNLRPGAQFSISGETYEDIEWHDAEQSIPSQQDLEVEIQRLAEEKIQNAYMKQRMRAYPTITDQLDMLWHMMDDETIPGKGSDWYNSILAVKQQFPKP